MIPELAPLRRKLLRLRRRLRVVRLATAGAGLASAAFGILGGAFLADWGFDMTPAERVVLLVVAAVVGCFAWRRFASPHLVRAESLLEVALAIEQREGIDSDLVAALEFESPQAESWGSAPLRAAVVERVVAIEPGLDVLAGVSTTVLRRRCLVFSAVAVLAASIALAFPAHTRAFFARIAFGDDAYPTRTRIDAVVVGGIVLAAPGFDRDRFAEAPARLAFPWGTSLTFEARCAGALPSEARVELAALVSRSTGAAHASIALLPGPEPGVFRGGLPRLVDTLRVEVRAGDARARIDRIDVVPLPIVHIELEATPPTHVAARGRAPRIEAGASHIAVVEGTRVDLEVRATNKRLEQVELTIDGASSALVPVDGEHRRFRLDRGASPLGALLRALDYSVQVVDEDGLSLDEPIAGHIGVLADQPPRIRALAVSTRVLPSARPLIEYAAHDDYGLDRIELRVRIERPGESPLEPASRVIRRLVPPEPAIADRYALELGPLGLRKSDRLTLVLEAFDARGELPGRSSTSDPVVLDVTDERGVIDAMNELDERSARQLDQIIEEQLGIGGPR